ncbi:MAG: bifunctional 4-hydroxy-2-oxoglutarate aldolase/2-dehydro-3-deoxy-phosphogluconate aldolase [Oscillospiraceae bacterium]|nr:bifunctional 4-hydroxy-2-oxoglutarate aldolase/2-dehydro-3-deoxy-phosphogluconate aldolase [Oscillospiraceae bacterium]
MDAFERIKKAKLVAIIRGVPEEKVLKTVEAMKRGGVSCCEVTFDQRADDFSYTARAIERIRRAFGDEITVGAGTVLTAEQVEIAYDAGAVYIISPDVNAEVIKRTKELGMVSIPGAMTPTEITAAWRLGADIVKVFPAGELGAGYIKAVATPISHVPLLAVGGIGVKNARNFLDAGCIGVGVSSTIVNRARIDAGDFDAITKIAREYVDAFGRNA